MNIFKFELKAGLKGSAAWTVLLIAALIAFMGGVYPFFSESVDDVLRVIEGFPPEFAAAFNLEISSMFSFGGFYGFGFSYFSLLGAIMATSLGLSSFAREKRVKCADFLLTKPMSREAIFSAKLLSGLAILVVANVFYVIASMAIGASNDEGGATMFMASLSLLLTQLVFYAAGVFFAVFAKRVRSVSGVATAFGFAGFILTALNNIFEEEAIRFIAPLKYFEPTALFASGAYEWQYALTGAVIAIACVAAAFVRFCKSDAHAV